MVIEMLRAHTQSLTLEEVMLELLLFQLESRSIQRFCLQNFVLSMEEANS